MQMITLNGVDRATITHTLQISALTAWCTRDTIGVRSNMFHHFRAQALPALAVKSTEVKRTHSDSYSLHMQKSYSKYGSEL